MAKFDVFLSFRGMDTRRGFVSHLYHSLSKQQIRTFKTDEDDGSGNEEALILIEQSMIAIAVISKNYIDSVWCLNELEKMIDCKEKGSLVIVPVFYNVDPNDFANKAKRKELREPEKWRDALVDLTLVYNAYAYGVEEDADMVDKVMDYITHHLRPTRSRKMRMSGDSVMIKPKRPSRAYLSTSKPIARPIQSSIPVHKSFPDMDKKKVKFTSVKTRHMDRCVTDTHSVPVISRFDRLIGMRKKVAEVNRLLELDSRDGVCEIGIWGWGGSGKTLLATCVYEEISLQFQDYYYHSVNNKDNNTSSLTWTAVLEEITRAALKTPLSESVVNKNCDVVNAKLGHRKVLLIVDGLDCIDQVKGITMVASFFGPGSRLILISQEKSLLVECDVKVLYEVESLRYDEALQLFSQVAFKSERIPTDFDEISLRAVLITGRLPLAIKVLGSLLQGRPITEWESELLKLETSWDKSFAEVSSQIKYPPKLNPSGREEARDKFPSYHFAFA